MNTEQFKAILLDIAQSIEKNKDYLSELDRAVGDGDHGVTMSIGWQAVVQKLHEQELLDEQDIGQICKKVAMTFLNSVGSSVGPLYATAFLKGGEVLQGKSELSTEDILLFLTTAGRGIQQRGKAEVGEKTMIDTWIPAIEALEEAGRQGKSLLECMQEAVKAGEEGMKSTASMVAKKGRASRLGERSKGHQDPGATSSYIILNTFLESLEKLGDIERKL